MGDYIVWMAAVLNVSACIAYASVGDLPRAFYWFGASVIVVSTVLIGK